MTTMREGLPAAHDATVEDAISNLPETSTDETIEAATEAADAATDVDFDSVLEVELAAAVTVQLMVAAMGVVAIMMEEAARVETTASTQDQTLARATMRE